MEMCTKPLHAAVRRESEERQVQIISDELARLLKQSRECSSQHQKALQVQFAESQEFISDNLDDIQTALAKFTETITDARISDWLRQSHQLLKLGRKSVDALQKFCDDIEQPLKESCEKLEMTTYQSIKTLNATIDAFYSDNFRRLIQNAEHSIEQVTEETTQNMATIRRQFNWLGYVSIGLISLLVALGFSSYLNAEWPWETHAKVSWQRNVGHAAMSVWPKLSNEDQQIILNSLSEIR